MKFYKDTHKYLHNGEPYLSVSDFRDQFKEPFPKRTVAEAVAKKKDKDPDEILNEWNMNRDVSIDYGNSIHKALELYIKYGKIHKLPHIKEVISQFKEKYDRTKIYPEIIAYNTSIRLSGTLDALLETSKGNFSIIDYKTNYELSKSQYKPYKSPLEHLTISKLNDYRIQLSLYKWLIEQYNHKVDKLILEHWNGEKLKTIELEPIKPIKVAKLIKKRKQQL